MHVRAWSPAWDNSRARVNVRCNALRAERHKTHWILGCSPTEASPWRVSSLRLPPWERCSERRSIGWAAWEDNSGGWLSDHGTGEWQSELLNALIDSKGTAD
jgi:hypothetical protein